MKFFCKATIVLLKKNAVIFFIFPEKNYVTSHKHLKGKDFTVFEDIPKKLYDLRKGKNDKNARKRGHSVFF